MIRISFTPSSMDLHRRSSSSRSPAPPPNPALPYREDCWSDGETASLVDAWGTRFLAAGRGILRQPQWQEVADTVNHRPSAAARRRPPRTDAQCKNRVDTLKKKYKIERTRIAAGELAGSPWQFYPRMHELLSDYIPPGSKKMPASPVRLPFSAQQQRIPPFAVPLRRPQDSQQPLPFAVPLPPYKRNLPLPMATPVRGSSPSPSPSPPPPPPAPRLNFDDSLYQKAAAAAAAAKKDVESDDGDDEDEDEGDEEDMPPPKAVTLPSQMPQNVELELDDDESVDEDEGLAANGNKRKRGGCGNGGILELAHSIDALAAAYERVEAERQKRAAEMEKGRMEFLKEIELQRMKVLVDAQVQLARISKSSNGEHVMNE